MGTAVEGDSASGECGDVDYVSWALETGLWDGRPVLVGDAAIFSQEVALRIMVLLESGHPAFDLLALQLARMGTVDPEALSLLDKEIAELKITADGQIIQVGFGKWISKTWKKHTAAIITGIVVVAVAAAVVAVSVCSAGTATGAALAGASATIGALDNALDKKESHHSGQNIVPTPGPAYTPPPSVDLSVPKQNFSPPPIPPSTFNFQQNGLFMGDKVIPYTDLVPHMQQESIFPRNPGPSQPSTPSWFSETLINGSHIPEAPKLGPSMPPFVEAFFRAESFNPTPPNPEFSSFMYQWRGQNSFQSGQFNQAIDDYTKAIQLTPNDLNLYRERGVSLFEQGQYGPAIADYNTYTSQLPKEYPFAISEFSLGFVKGLPQGVYDSGEGLFLLVSDLIRHPIDTSKQMYESIEALSKLVRSEEWSTVSQALAPEIHQLVLEWDTLPSEKRGELTGYAFGKYGADILIPGALAKAASQGLKGAEALGAIGKSFRAAEQTLLLESAAALGDTAKAAEVLQSSQKTLNLGEMLGFSPGEMGQLKQAGNLEGAINSGLETLVSQSESDVYKVAMSQNKHARMVRDYLDKPAKEIQKGINSYEKQIAIHKDKIVNPTKYYPDWDKLDPRQREALINKKWPTEIQVYEEQKKVLQSILDERIPNE